jgi:DNA anti-recombination protein RmuC
VNQLSEGKDNILKQVEKLKTLGAKAKKTLPEDGLPLLDAELESGG